MCHGNCFISSYSFSQFKSSVTMVIQVDAQPSFEVVSMVFDELPVAFGT